MGDIILWFSIGLIVWWIFSSKKKKTSPKDDPNLTETQRRWQAYRASEAAKQQLEHGADEYNERLEGLDDTTRQALQKLLEMRDYINTHKRPFKFSEWLMWEVEPLFLKKYCSWMILYFAASFSPMFWGWPVSIFFVMLWWLIIDSMFYKQKLVLEVTEWNPEWHEKFVEKDK